MHGSKSITISQYIKLTIVTDREGVTEYKLTDSFEDEIYLSETEAALLKTHLPSPTNKNKE